MPHPKDHDGPGPGHRPHHQGTGSARSIGGGHADATRIAGLGRTHGPVPPFTAGPPLTRPSRTPDPGLRPTGNRTGAHPFRPEDLGRRREDEAAATLARNGYQVEQNPPTRANGRNPDYRVEGEYVDCYAPKSDNPEKVRNSLSKKLRDGQAKRFVLKMEDTSCSLEEIAAVLRRKPIRGLEEIIVVRDDKIMPFYPFGE
ncbi:hypothetical protein ACWT_5630 [Actinoplanes sp. SE50]|uniref:CdiA C-terminal domain-containing protein n=1 Tax=unclassified Actinoplanes TaxID=2626549 RepID=UPI00023ED0FA|nr:MULTISPECIES: hypothetical protein [unclassified Actinoplanes]AEV86647.1 hypothetical protein ACPL_5760 [Actinoplanes sp. SE50/110]ATO85045.1 hypothetical protein ACWT_5630 [Actinoplanes sp. SE50]SLM02455.1 hypothetical protein ACSP50_5705 [Actinoplanes sp. SE50/110]